MKNVIVTVAEILLGIVLFMLIFGQTNSLRSRSGEIFTDVIAETVTITTTEP